MHHYSMPVACDNDDGTVTRIHEDGSVSTEQDGSMSITQDGGMSISQRVKQWENLRPVA
jgi:hypothetical protein